MAVFQFRLQVLLDQRTEALRKAEEELGAREEELVGEQRAMKELEEEVIRTEELYRRKRVERVTAGPGAGASLSSRSARLAALQMDVQAARAGVLSQQIFVDQAKVAVSEARAEAETRRRDVDLLEKYQQKAKAKFLLEEAYREELEQDEIGNVMHLSRRAKR
jgi:flagellar biosynthesis chaperone FliJ